MAPVISGFVVFCRKQS